MMVIYDPEAHTQQRPEAVQGFAEYLRRGGRPHPIPISGGPRDLEGKLLAERAPRSGEMKGSGESEALRILRISTRHARFTQCAILIVLVFSAVVFVIVGFLAMQANDGINAARAMIQPHAATIVNSTVETMKNMGGSMMSVREITTITAELAKKDLGPNGAAGKALNSSAVIAARLAEFFEHPTIQLSLGGTR